MKNILPLLIIMQLTSCDPVVSYEKIIQNDSSYDIWLIKNDTSVMIDFPQDSVLLVSKESLKIDSAIDIGGSVNNYESCPLYPFPSDTLRTRIVGNTDLELKATIDINAAWSYRIMEPGQNGLAECRLVITDNDIE